MRKDIKPPCYFEETINKEGCAGYSKTLTGQGECGKCRFF